MRLAPEWQKELNDFIRASSGAFLFGTPLLWTMEMWWIGQYIEMWKLLLFLVVVFVVNVHLNYFAGFKPSKRRSLRYSITQAIDATAVGIITSTVILVSLNRISPGDSLDSSLGRIVIQAIPLSIGASVANALLAVYEGKDRASSQNQHISRRPWQTTLNDLGATFAGAIFVCFSIAPTEEVPMLAAELTYWHELLLLAISVLTSYAIVFESGFSPIARVNGNQGIFQRPLPETCMAYFVSLLVALAALYLFDQFALNTPPKFIFSQVLVLGFPAAIGGAAGRLVI